MTIPDSMTELVADLDATVDYISDRVTERADSSDFDELVAMQDAVNKVAKACKDALAIIKGEQVAQLEDAGSRMVGSRTFVRVPDTKVRFDHAAISRALREKARDQAVNKETGEIDTELALGELAADLMAVYVAPATTAKVTVLKEMDINVKSVSERKRTGWKIEVIDTELPDDDE